MRQRTIGQSSDLTQETGERETKAGEAPRLLFCELDFRFLRRTPGSPASGERAAQPVGKRATRKSCPAPVATRDPSPAFP